jgi:hypothetical protein
MAMICEFCGAKFLAACNLITHKRTAKYCLALRDEDSLPYSCEFCKKTFTTEIKWEKHVNICDFKEIEHSQTLLDEKDNTIQELREALITQNDDFKTIIRDLELKIVKLETSYELYEKEFHAIRDRPTTTIAGNNTNTSTVTSNKLKTINTSTIEPFTTDLVQKRLNEGAYTYEIFLTGAKGVKSFILDMIIKGDEKNYSNTDVSRSNFHRFKETRKWILDVGAKFLSEVFVQMRPLVEEYSTRLIAEVKLAKTNEEHEHYLHIDELVEPVIFGIRDKPDTKHHKKLLGDVVAHIKPYVAV